MVLDPISNLAAVGISYEVKSMLMRLVDYLKSHSVTLLLTNLTIGGTSLEHTDIALSSLIDTWIVLRDVERGGERNREIHVLKSRGMAHSNQLREFVLTDNGIRLLDVYTGPAGVLTGTARVTQEAKERADAILKQQDIQRRKREINQKREVVEAQIKALQTEIVIAEEELQKESREEDLRNQVLTEEAAKMARMRGADEPNKKSRQGRG